jgi:hypothetical protein
MRRKRSGQPPTLGYESYSSLMRTPAFLPRRTTRKFDRPAAPDTDDGGGQLPEWLCQDLSHLGEEVRRMLDDGVVYDEVWMKPARTLRITTIQPKEQYL